MATLPSPGDNRSLESHRNRGTARQFRCSRPSILDSGCSHLAVAGTAVRVVEAAKAKGVAMEAAASMGDMARREAAWLAVAPVVATMAVAS